MDQARQEASPGTTDQASTNIQSGIVQSNNAISTQSATLVGPAIAPTTTASLSCLAENLTISERSTKSPEARPKEQRVSKKRKTSSTERRLRADEPTCSHQSRRTRPAARTESKTKQPSIVSALGSGAADHGSREPAPADKTTTLSAAEEACGYQPPPADITIPRLEEGSTKTTEVETTSPLREPAADDSTAAITYRYSYATAVGRIEEAAPQKETTTPSYTTKDEETSISRLNISFRKEEPESDFSILPEADRIWRQARTCFIAAEKAKLRSERLISWAKQRLVPAWAVGCGPTPSQFTSSNSIFQNRFGETLRMQACDNLFILAEGLKHEAQTKESQGQAYYQSLAAIYANDNAGLQKITGIITRFVNRDTQIATTALNKQEADLRASPKTSLDILNMRNPPEEQPSSGKNRRNSRSRSPRQRTKRRRSSSRPRRSRSRGRFPRTSTQAEEDRLTNLFRQFLRKNSSKK